MPDTVVRCPAQDGQIRELPIRFLGRDQNFVLQTAPLETRMSAEIGPRLLDLLEITAAIFCADSSISRGANHQPKDGRSWRRQMDFTFAVRDKAFWEQPDVERVLRDAVEFMTDDRITCHFIETSYSPNVQSYFNFQQDAEQAFRVDDVVLFSGGLDSLAGTLETLARTDRRIALVTHRSAPKTMKHQNELIKRLETEFKDRFIWIPVLVHRKRMRSHESTQRSRSLLFSALGCVVATMLGASRIQFFENGVVSQNLPLAKPIVGTLATRTTHPQTLRHLQALLSIVTESMFDVTNSFEWLTKTEVVKRVVDSGHADLIPLTVSCNHTFKRQSDVRHCGNCSQCLDRRFAIAANGLEHQEKDKDYAVDVLFGERNRDNDRALAIEWVRHARNLSGLDQLQFQTTFMSELLRVTQPYVDRQDAVKQSYEMHRRHGEAVVGVLNEITESRLTSAPERSLAKAFSGHTKTFRGPDPFGGQVDTQPMRVSLEPIGILEVERLADSHVRILDLQDFTAARARIISCLLERLLEDKQSGVPIAKFRTMKAREIADELGVTEDYVRQEVKRIRDDLRESWRVIRTTEPPKFPLILSKGKDGYRLDPSSHFVSSSSAS